MALIPALSQAADSASPRFVSLRADEVNLRTGPGVRYPVDWVYRRRHLPVEVVAQFENWRKIRDWQGTEGWVHQSMLTTARNVLVTGEVRALYRKPAEDSVILARIEPGVIGTMRKCEVQWCRIEIAGLAGWLKRTDFWGPSSDEAAK